MAWGSVTVGGIVFREGLSADDSGDALKLSGQESYPPSPVAEVRAAHDNVRGLRGQTVPVVFTDKTQLTGIYLVDGASSVLVDEQNGAVVTATWSMSLQLLGSGRDVEFESRIPQIGRADELAGTQTPSFWHAPPVGFADYFTGPTVPGGTVVRGSQDGAVTVYSGLPNVAPRWTVPAESFMAGSARVLLDGIRRSGTVTASHEGWEISNGIVRVASDGAGFTVSAWSGSAWESVKGYRPAVSGTNLAVVPELTILRNDAEEVAVRLTYPTAPGRVTVDLGLRRGSRFVTGVMKRHAAATLGIRRTAAETVAAVTGGLRASSADADGNRFVMGSSRLLGTVDTSTAYMSKAAVTLFDFFLGVEFGASPASGDAFADLLAQYLGSTSAQTRPVRR